MARRIAAQKPPKQATREAQAVADGLEKLQRQTGDHPLLRGDARELTLVSLAAGSNVIQHGLGKVPRIWLVTRAEVGAASVYETARDSRSLTLTAAAPCTIDIVIIG